MVVPLEHEGGRLHPAIEPARFVDNLYRQIVYELKKLLFFKFNTLLWLFPPGCTYEVQTVDAGYGKVKCDREILACLENGEEVQKRESNISAASEPRVC